MLLRYTQIIKTINKFWASRFCIQSWNIKKKRQKCPIPPIVANYYNFSFRSIDLNQFIIKNENYESYHDRQDSVACKKQCQPRDTLCLFNTTQSITFQHIASNYCSMQIVIFHLIKNRLLDFFIFASIISSNCQTGSFTYGQIFFKILNDIQAN